MIFSGSLLHIFPIQNDSTNKWISPQDISMGIDNKTLQSDLTILFTDYYKGLMIGEQTGNWNEANNKLERIFEYQNKNSDQLPSKAKIKAEIFYNKINFFKRAAFAYMISGLLLLILAFVQIFKTSISYKYLSQIFKYLILLIFYWTDCIPWSKVVYFRTCTMEQRVRNHTFYCLGNCFCRITFFTQISEHTCLNLNFSSNIYLN